MVFDIPSTPAHDVNSRPSLSWLQFRSNYVFIIVEAQVEYYSTFLQCWSPAKKFVTDDYSNPVQRYPNCQPLGTFQIDSFLGFGDQRKSCVDKELMVQRSCNFAATLMHINVKEFHFFKSLSMSNSFSSDTIHNAHIIPTLSPILPDTLKIPRNSWSPHCRSPR